MISVQQQPARTSGNGMMMRRLLVVLGLCGVFVLTACTTMRGSTPEEAAHTYFLHVSQNSPYKITDWQVHAVRPNGNTSLVLASYAATSTDEPGMPTIAYAEVSQGVRDWSVVRGQSTGGLPLPPLVMYTSTTLHDGTFLVYGQFIAPDVHALEATFDNGAVVRDAGTNGSFALIAPGASSLRELRVLDAQQHVMRRYQQQRVTTASEERMP